MRYIYSILFKSLSPRWWYDSLDLLRIFFLGELLQRRFPVSFRPLWWQHTGPRGDWSPGPSPWCEATDVDHYNHCRIQVQLKGVVTWRRCIIFTIVEYFSLDLFGGRDSSLGPQHKSRAGQPISFQYITFFFFRFPVSYWRRIFILTGRESPLQY